MPIIKSIIDNDLYKFTMQNAILKYKQGIFVKYGFINRRLEGRFNQDFLYALKNEIKSMGDLKATALEIDFLRSSCPFLGEEYLQFLKNFSFDPSDVFCDLSEGELVLEIKGLWERTILWEVPLMALISELFYIHCDTDWDYSNQCQKVSQKGKALENLTYADFGTRRRRSFYTQQIVNLNMGNKGTSNVLLAMQYNKKPIGTMAHEWIMGISALESLRHANRYALQIWNQVYKGNLGIALPDTFGTKAFFEDFDGILARLFDGIRHDSGDPMVFANNCINHYKNLGINPATKTLVFTDNLNVTKALEIQEQLKGIVQVAFGIGTHLTNDFVCKSDPSKISKPLNIVIKLQECNGVPVVKLGDDSGKATGDQDALIVANWTFNKTPIYKCAQV